MKESITFLLVACILSACASNAQNSATPVAVENMENTDFLTRPQFGKPVLRPLGHVLLSWNKAENTDGYELQESDTESFNTILQNWTMSGSSIEIPFKEGVPRWYRVRSFTLENVSRWSPVFRLDGKVLQ